jgi:ElaB/YqjD/DUF883 family membrane-anchored ribosome-binding protein
MANVSDTVSEMTNRTGVAMRDSGSSLIDYVRENPVPLALVGLGLGMLAFSTRRTRTPTYDTTYTTESEGYGYGYSGSNAGSEGVSLADRAQGVVNQASTAVSSAAGSVRDAASNAADTARHHFNRISDQAVQRAQVARDQFSSTMNDNPVSLGIVALAAGAIIGLSLPTTRVEQEYMGDAREELFDRAKSAAHDAVEKVQNIAEQAAESVKNVAGLAAQVSNAAGA